MSKFKADPLTLHAYDTHAADYVEEWLAQPSPQELHTMAQKFFRVREPTADIGSGSGRDVHWLNQAGYPTAGWDASQGLLQEARKRFPNYTFGFAELPDLNQIESARFSNVLCETVLMHLPKEALSIALKNLLRILKPDGVLALSWRLPQENAEREKDGRLYTLLTFEDLLTALQPFETQVLHQEEMRSFSSKKIIRQLVLQRK